MQLSYTASNLLLLRFLGLFFFFFFFAVSRTCIEIEVEFFTKSKVYKSFTAVNVCFSHTFCRSLLCNISTMFLGFLKTENGFYLNLRLFLSALLLVFSGKRFYYLN